jgi:hypothetical protein
VMAAARAELTATPPKSVRRRTSVRLSLTPLIGLVAALATAMGLVACGGANSNSGLSTAAAKRLQADVLAVTRAAAARNFTAAQAGLVVTRRDLAAAQNDGQVSADRAQRVQSAIDKVSADLRAASAPSTTAPTTTSSSISSSSASTATSTASTTSAAQTTTAAPTTSPTATNPPTSASTTSAASSTANGAGNGTTSSTSGNAAGNPATSPTTTSPSS